MNQLDINKEKILKHGDLKYTWQPKNCLGVIYGMEIYRGWQENLTTNIKERIIIKIFKYQDKEFEKKLKQISEIQAVSGHQTIQVRQTLFLEKIIQINDPYEQTLHEQQYQQIYEQEQLQKQLEEEYEIKQKQKQKDLERKAQQAKIQEQSQQQPQGQTQVLQQVQVQEQIQSQSQQAQNQEQQQIQQEQIQQEEEMINLENYKKYIWTQLDIIEQLEDVAATMHLIHANGFIHGNINKQTIVFHNKKFHLAHFENYQKVDNSQTSKNYAELGEKNYIKPPEPQLHVKSDVYQLGVVFYMMKTGQQEFISENLKKYSIDPIILLIQRMTEQSIENRCSSLDVLNGIRNIKDNQQLQGIYLFSSIDNHLQAWQFLFDTIQYFDKYPLFNNQDYSTKQYLSILFQTMRFHQFRIEQYQKQLIQNKYEFFDSKHSLIDIINQQYKKLIKDTQVEVDKFQIKIEFNTSMELKDLQIIQDRISKPYFIQTLQISNNIHDLHQFDLKLAQDKDELQLCIRLFFCLPLEYLHINIKERTSQFEDMMDLDYYESIIALEQQINFYFQKLYDLY